MAEYVTKIRTAEGDKQIDYNALANLPDLDNLDNVVPNTRTINKKALSKDITLTAQDVGAALAPIISKTDDIVEGETYLADGQMYIVVYEK